MIERFTVDQLADAIDEQLKGARPKPKLLRRFFCAGKRDGKHGRTSGPTQAYLTDGVSIASSRIAEDYIATRSTKQTMIEQIKVRLSQRPGAREPDIETPGDARHATTPANEVDAPSFSDAEPRALPTEEDLTQALAALARVRAERAAAQVAAQAAAEAEQRRAEAAKQAAEVAELTEQLAMLESELGSLADQYRQLVESCHSVGRFLWSRYCDGYIRGRAKVGRDDTGIPSPSPDVDFVTPAVLPSLTTSAVEG